MLFNSYEFIFAFLPVTIAGFYLLGPVSRRWALHWLILASFFFYAWWRPLNVLLIAPSILINVHSRRIESFTLQDYCLFVLFFPQLIAGPIVHYREMMPQFHGAPCRFDKENFAVGLTLLMFGLFKKAVIADGIAPSVTSIYDHAAGGGGVSLLFAWIAAIGFTLQLYFDFSGYTDMALGAARLFGIRLPPNFNSPLRASSIIDFWLRWHMTLTRFLTAYIYNPLVLAL